MSGSSLVHQPTLLHMGGTISRCSRAQGRVDAPWADEFITPKKTKKLQTD